MLPFLVLPSGGGDLPDDRERNRRGRLNGRGMPRLCGRHKCREMSRPKASVAPACAGATRVRQISSTATAVASPPPMHRLAMPRVLPWRWSARSEEHTSELQSLMRISYAVFCLKKKNKKAYI